MTTQATGTVIDGQLQLDRPLPLPNQSRVTVTVQSAIDVPADWRERMTQGLAAMEKLKADHPIGSGGLRFTRDELHERD
jgi:hypothetical protein